MIQLSPITCSFTVTHNTYLEQALCIHSPRPLTQRLICFCGLPREGKNRHSLELHQYKKRSISPHSLESIRRLGVCMRTKQSRADCAELYVGYQASSNAFLSPKKSPKATQSPPISVSFLAASFLVFVAAPPKAHPGGEGNGRTWTSLRHRLHETLVESGEKHMERVQSLPKMSQLVMTIRNNVSRTKQYTKDISL